MWGVFKKSAVLHSSHLHWRETRRLSQCSSRGQETKFLISPLNSVFFTQTFCGWSSIQTMRSLKKLNFYQPIKGLLQQTTELSSSSGVSVKKVRKWWMAVKTWQSLVRHFAKLATYRDNAVLPAFLVSLFVFILFCCHLFCSIHSEIQWLKIQ